VLVRHRWPGNVRELENVIYRSAVIAQGDAILVKDLPIEIRDETGISATAGIRAESPAQSSVPPIPASEPPNPPATIAPAAFTLVEALDFVFAQLHTGDEPVIRRIEREMITRALAADGGDATKASKRLGISRAVLQKKAREG
jgi:two-component system nitrogen regulation response regulator GlnG